MHYTCKCVPMNGFIFCTTCYEVMHRQAKTERKKRNFAIIRSGNPKNISWGDEQQLLRQKERRMVN